MTFNETATASDMFPGRLAAPRFMQYGQDYAGAPDGGKWVYVFFPGTSGDSAFFENNDQVGMVGTAFCCASTAFLSCLLLKTVAFLAEPGRTDPAGASAGGTDPRAGCLRVLVGAGGGWDDPVDL